MKQNEQSNQQPEEISEVQPPPPVTKKIQFNFSQEEIDSILNEHNESRIFSQSVTRVNGNVESIYWDFCSAVKKDPFPVTKELGVGFLGVLARSGWYALSTLYKVFYFALKRLNKLYTNEEIPIDITQAMCNKLSNLKFSE